MADKLFELTELRSFNGKTYKLSGGQNQTEIHGKWIHYLKENGDWDNIDLSLADNGEHFVADRGPFSVKLPKFADEAATFTSTVRYDIFEKKNIDDAPFDTIIRAKTAEHVSGVITNLPLKGVSVECVLYENAYPKFNADLIYWLDYGRAPRLAKLVRFNKKIDVNVEIPFEISHPEGSTIEAHDKYISPIIKQLNDERIAAIQNEKDIKQYYKDLFRFKQLEKRIWDKSTQLQQIKALSVRSSGAVGRRGSAFKDFKIWDSSEERKVRSIDVKVKVISDDLYELVKIVPVAFFSDAVLPVYTDTTSTFYPDADPESTTVDGTTRGSSATYSTAHDTPTSAGDSAASARIWHGLNGGTYYIDRHFYLFDTSSIGSGSDVSAATFSVWAINAPSNVDSDTLNLVLGTPVSNTAIGTGDYGSVGTTSLASVAFSSLGSNGVYQNMTVSDLTTVSKTGITKYALRTSKDISSSAPTGDTYTPAYAFAETADATADPKLVVVHALSTPNVNVSDTAAVSESISLLAVNLVSVSDLPAVSESLKVYFEADVNISDAVSVSENITIQGGANPSVSEVISVSENISLEIITEVNVTDSVVVGESPNVALVTLINTSDSAAVSEVVAVESITFINVSDTVAVSENVVIQGGANPDISDTVVISENVVLDIATSTTLSDSILVSENVNTTITFGPGVSDTVAVSENLNVEISSQVNVSDGVSITDLPRYWREAVIVSETVSVVVMPPDLLVSVSDSVVITESFSVLVLMLVGVSDSVSITEVLSIFAQPYITATNVVPQFVRIDKDVPKMSKIVSSKPKFTQVL